MGTVSVRLFPARTLVVRCQCAGLAARDYSPSTLSRGPLMVWRWSPPPLQASFEQVPKRPSAWAWRPASPRATWRGTAGPDRTYISLLERTGRMNAICPHRYISQAVEGLALASHSMGRSKNEQEYRQPRLNNLISINSQRYRAEPHRGNRCDDATFNFRRHR